MCHPLGKVKLRLPGAWVRVVSPLFAFTACYPSAGYELSRPCPLWWPWQNLCKKYCTANKSLCKSPILMLMLNFTSQRVFHLFNRLTSAIIKKLWNIKWISVDIRCFSDAMVSFNDFGSILKKIKNKQRKSICSEVSCPIWNLYEPRFHKINIRWTFPFKINSYNIITVLSYNDYFDYTVRGNSWPQE